jgi:hypothetical protein
MALVHKRTIWPSDRSLSAKFVPTFANRVCCVVSAMDPHGHILGFLDWSHYYFFQVAPQLYSWGWVDPIQTHYFSENLAKMWGPRTTPKDWLIDLFYVNLPFSAIYTPLKQQVITVLKRALELISTEGCHSCQVACQLCCPSSITRNKQILPLVSPTLEVNFLYSCHGGRSQNR